MITIIITITLPCRRAVMARIPTRFWLAFHPMLSPGDPKFSGGWGQTLPLSERLSGLRGVRVSSLRVSFFPLFVSFLYFFSISFLVIFSVLQEATQRRARDTRASTPTFPFVSKHSVWLSFFQRNLINPSFRNETCEIPPNSDDLPNQQQNLFPQKQNKRNAPK